MGDRPSRRLRPPHRPAHVVPEGVGSLPCRLAGRAEPRERPARSGRARTTRLRRRRPHPRGGGARAASFGARGRAGARPGRLPGSGEVESVAATGAHRGDGLGPGGDRARRLRGRGVGRRCGAGTPHDGQRLMAALDARRRIARRAFLRALLTDIESGTHSALEHAYLVAVERRHGLPRSTRQSSDRLGTPPVAARSAYHDVEYVEYALIVELDGVVGHIDARGRAADLTRDLVVKTSGRDTVRLGWAQATRQACTTAELVGRLLTHGGWVGTPIRCPDCP